VRGQIRSQRLEYRRRERGTQYGSASDNYPCTDNGNDCSASAANPIYARSVVGVLPSAYATWFQALQACANSGKRLLTNAEWQMAAAGTTDPGSNNDPNAGCNTNFLSTANTGSSSGAGANACASNWDAYDMIGNLNEWVADWMHGSSGAVWNPSTGNAGASYGGGLGDAMVGTNPADLQGTGSSNFPGAIYRGGAFAGGVSAGVFSVVTNVAPSYSGNNIGFRCAR
jgi:formylglycine-generating enzyme required for sulfatase activity